MLFHSKTAYTVTAASKLIKLVKEVFCFLFATTNTDSQLSVCLYVSLSGVLDPSLKAALESFSSKRRYEFWSNYMCDLVCVACDGEEEGLRSLSESQMLISAWRTLLILSTSHVSSYTQLSTSHGYTAGVYHNLSRVFVV